MMGVLQDEKHIPSLQITASSTAPPSSSRSSSLQIPLFPPLILEGRLCSSAYVENDWHCSFDRSTITGREMTPIKPLQNSDKETSSSPSLGPGASKVEDDCPICAYMKRGPCANEFTSWMACMDSLEGATPAGEEEVSLSKCSQLTGSMTSCMQQHEYYDIFVAGMSEKLEASSSVADSDSAGSKTTKA